MAYGGNPRHCLWSDEADEHDARTMQETISDFEAQIRRLGVENFEDEEIAGSETARSPHTSDQGEGGAKGGSCGKPLGKTGFRSPEDPRHDVNAEQKRKTSGSPRLSRHERDARRGEGCWGEMGTTSFKSNTPLWIQRQVPQNEKNSRSRLHSRIHCVNSRGNERDHQLA